MQRPSRRSPPWLALAVLLPAGGLVALGLVGLSAALQAAEARSAEEARLSARATARGVDALLRRPETLAALPDEFRFALGPEGLLPPPELGWLEAPPPEPPCPRRAEDLLLQAEEVEFRQGDPAAAAGLLESKLATGDASPAERDALRLGLAWLAHRRGDPDRLAGLLAALEEPAPAPGVLLLEALAGRPAPAWAETCLLDLRPARALGLLARLEELAPGACDGALPRWKDAVERAASRRERLRALLPLASRLAGADRPAIEPLGPWTLLFFPPDRGALLPPAELLARLRAASDGSAGGTAPALPPLPWSGTPGFGPAPPEALALFPGAWLAPAAVPPTGLWGHPWLLPLLLCLLGGATLLGLGLVLAAAARERRALAVRGEFLTTVTHELRTPIASIRLFSEMLQERPAPPQERQTEYLRLMAGESARLAALVENVLDLGRMERGERAYDLRPLDLGALAAEALELFGPLAARSDMELTGALPPGEVAVLGDRQALLQALCNLLENARKFAREGKAVALALATADGKALLRIRDRGPGVPLPERERIFERFARGARDGSIPGVGLGLHLARRIARAHGGELCCLDPPDGPPGACFELSLPLLEREP